MIVENLLPRLFNSRQNLAANSWSISHKRNLLNVNVFRVQYNFPPFAEIYFTSLFHEQKKFREKMFHQFANYHFYSLICIVYPFIFL